MSLSLYSFFRRHNHENCSEIAVAVVAVLLAIVGILGAFTFPREVLTFPVSFTKGADDKRAKASFMILLLLVYIALVFSNA